MLVVVVSTAFPGTTAGANVTDIQSEVAYQGVSAAKEALRGVCRQFVLSKNCITGGGHPGYRCSFISRPLRGLTPR